VWWRRKGAEHQRGGRRDQRRGRGAPTAATPSARRGTRSARPPAPTAGEGANGRRAATVGRAGPVPRRATRHGQVGQALGTRRAGGALPRSRRASSAPARQVQGARGGGCHHGRPAAHCTWSRGGATCRVGGAGDPCPRALPATAANHRPPPRPHLRRGACAAAKWAGGAAGPSPPPASPSSPHTHTHPHRTSAARPWQGVAGHPPAATREAARHTVGRGGGPRWLRPTTCHPPPPPPPRRPLDRRQHPPLWRPVGGRPRPRSRPRATNGPPDPRRRHHPRHAGKRCAWPTRRGVSAAQEARPTGVAASARPNPTAPPRPAGTRLAAGDLRAGACAAAAEAGGRHRGG